VSRRYPPRFSGGRPLDGVPLCRGKVSYSTWTAATKAAGRTRIDAGEGPALNAFHCRDCGRFHTGNNVLGKRR
jgi:hypothetical protein